MQPLLRRHKWMWERGLRVGTNPPLLFFASLIMSSVQASNSLFVIYNLMSAINIMKKEEDVACKRSRAVMVLLFLAVYTLCVCVWVLIDVRINQPKVCRFGQNGTGTSRQNYKDRLPHVFICRIVKHGGDVGGRLVDRSNAFAYQLKTCVVHPTEFSRWSRA